MAGYPGGAGNLSSYMSSGGGGETPSQSSTSGNGQSILLLFVAGIVCALLLSVKVNQNTSSNNGGGNNKGNNSSSYYKNSDKDSDQDGGNKGNNGNYDDNYDGGNNGQGNYNEYDNSIDGEYDDEEYDVVGEFNSLEDLNLDNIFEKLSETKTWVKVGDDDLILKVLENKTFENSLEDDFEIEVTKLKDVEKGLAEYLVELNMKEEEQSKEVYISMIQSYDVNGAGTNHTVQNTNSKKFIIIASDKLKEVRITTKDKVVIAGGDITISNIVKRGNYLSFDATSINGIEEVQLIDSNNSVIASHRSSSKSGKISVPNKEGAIKIRLIDKNGFMSQESI